MKTNPERSGRSIWCLYFTQKNWNVFVNDMLRLLKQMPSCHFTHTSHPPQWHYGDSERSKHICFNLSPNSHKHLEANVTGKQTRASIVLALACCHDSQTWNSALNTAECNSQLPTGGCRALGCSWGCMFEEGGHYLKVLRQVVPLPETSSSYWKSECSEASKPGSTRFFSKHFRKGDLHISPG